MVSVDLTALIRQLFGTLRGDSGPAAVACVGFFCKLHSAITGLLQLKRDAQCHYGSFPGILLLLHCDCDVFERTFRMRSRYSVRCCYTQRRRTAISVEGAVNESCLYRVQ